jgi:hypothetical protein
MTSPVTIETVSAAEPLLQLGFQMVEDLYDERAFGNGLVLFRRGDVRIRVAKERGLWFVEIGSVVTPDEFFDARQVLAEIGAANFADDATDKEALRALCTCLAEHAARWELLFAASAFHTARRALRERQIEAARQIWAFDVSDVSDV